MEQLNHNEFIFYCGNEIKINTFQVVVEQIILLRASALVAINMVVLLQSKICLHKTLW